MSRPVPPSSSVPLVAIAARAALLALAGLAFAGSACTMAVDETGQDGRAVASEEAAACKAPATPIPAGWKVRVMPSFSVAAPAEGLLVAQPTETMVQFFSPEPGTSLAAFERRDLGSLADAAGTWKQALGARCAFTVEPTTYLCDEAMRVHATCPGDRTTDVLLVLRHGAVFSASCELAGGDAEICARFLETLRLQ